MARLCALRARAVALLALPGLAMTHSLVRLLTALALLLSLARLIVLTLPVALVHVISHRDLHCEKISITPLV